MNRPFWTPLRTAGGLLVASLLVLPIAAIIMVATGAFRVFGATLQGSLAEMAPYADTYRLLTYGYTAAWIIQLLGMAMLARLLLRKGDEHLAVPALVLVVVAGFLGVLHGAHAAEVMTWAAREAALTGSFPAGYEALDLWVSSAFGVGYAIHLVGEAGFGWGVLRTRLTAPWVGWAVIGWSALWFVGYLLGAGAPAVLFVTPAIIGAALLRS